MVVKYSCAGEYRPWVISIPPGTHDTPQRPLTTDQEPPDDRKVPAASEQSIAKDAEGIGAVLEHAKTEEEPDK